MQNYPVTREGDQADWMGLQIRKFRKTINKSINERIPHLMAEGGTVPFLTVKVNMLSSSWPTGGEGH